MLCRRRSDDEVDDEAGLPRLAKGRVAKVKVLGHAEEVLAAAKALGK